MAQIDSSIYSQQQIPDIMGNVQKGLAMRDLMDQRALQQKKLAEDQSIKDAFKSGMVKNTDGSVSFDNNVVMSNLHQIDPKLSYDFYKKTKEEEAAKLKAKWDQDYKKQDFDLRKQELGSKALDRKEARDERRFQSGLKMQSGEYLPLDQKKMIEGLSTKNASKIGIKNQIDAVMSSWDNLDDDQKLAQGGQLLKTLNSPEGADAIGAEEAKRLGYKLEFAMGNFTNGRPTQFGRDLEGFKTQAQNTSKNLGTAVEYNQREVDKMLGRKTTQAPMSQQPKTPIFKTSDIEW